MSAPPAEMEEIYLRAGKVRLHVAAAGPPDGPLLVFLHGFPDFWYGWRWQIPFFAQHGFRVLAPDQRGYNLSEKPRGLDAYTLDRLAGDVLELINASSRGRAFVVGHDWGGAVAWALAGLYPGRVERLVVLNAPHPHVLSETIRHNPRQLAMSWYMAAFQIPRLPESLMARRDGQFLVQALCGTSRPGAFTAQDLERYRAAWRQPGACVAMLNWYRAAFRRRAVLPAAPTHAPLLLLWGLRDRFLGREAALRSIARCEQGQIEFFKDATHWLHMEEPQEVNRRILEFICS
jgi:epoxide hydrolase 4